MSAKQRKSNLKITPRYLKKNKIKHRKSLKIKWFFKLGGSLVLFFGLVFFILFSDYFHISKIHFKNVQIDDQQIEILLNQYFNSKIYGLFLNSHFLFFDNQLATRYLNKIISFDYLFITKEGSFWQPEILVHYKKRAPMLVVVREYLSQADQSLLDLKRLDLQQKNKELLAKIESEKVKGEDSELEVLDPEAEPEPLIEELKIEPLAEVDDGFEPEVLKEFWLVDNKGSVLKKIPILEKKSNWLLQLHYYHPSSWEVGDLVLSVKTIDNLFQLEQNLLPRYGLRSQKFILNQARGVDLEVLLTAGFILKLSQANDLSNQIELAAHFLETVEFDTSRLEYLDLRIKGRIYYRLK